MSDDAYHCPECGVHWGDHGETCSLAPVSGSGSVGNPAWILKEFERLIEHAPGQVALLIRSGDRIIIRDNSGITGLTGERLMQKSIALLDELFRSPNDAHEPAAKER